MPRMLVHIEWQIWKLHPSFYMIPKPFLFLNKNKKLTKHLTCQNWFSVIYNKIIEFINSPKGKLMYL